MRRIDDDPTRRERQAVGGRDPRSQMGFHVDDDRPGAVVKRALGRRVGHGRIAAGNRRVHSPRQSAQQALRPVGIGRVAVAIRDDGRCHDPLAGGQMRREPAGDAEADHASAPAFDFRFQRCPGAQSVADDGNPSGDPGFEREPRNRDHRAKVANGAHVGRATQHAVPVFIPE